jgi:hypothetical protein
MTRFGFGTDIPNEEIRPQWNIKADNIPNRLNRQKQILSVQTPENTIPPVMPAVRETRHNQFWPDDNEAQNPVNKLVSNENVKNPEFLVPQIRVGPKEEPNIDERFPHQFEPKIGIEKDQKRPSNFNDFFNVPK